MTDADTYEELSTEAQKVVDWRLEWLLRDGRYKTGNAERIALEMDIDYKFAIELHKKCDNERLCMKILLG